MTSEEFRAARATLGLSAEKLARLVEVSDGKTVRRWASGERDVPGPVSVLLRAMLDSRAVRRYFGVATETDIVEKTRPLPADEGRAGEAVPHS